MKAFDNKNNNNTFIYSDGGEKKLDEIFKDSRFDEYTTWRKYTCSWPLFYHLSPERKNLLRWIDFDKNNLKILELGAGCGAITSYFASLKNKPRVVAVEGSESRAKLIRTRCKNSDNLKVVIKNIQDYKDDEKYDFVTLIGVIEYAGRYLKGSNPFQDIIKQATKFLKPNGVLVIAIENQFGHKYLAGYNEDHYGKPFEGVSDYPNYNGIRTFDKKKLQEMISDSGLNIQKWYFPYPDYKMPRVILNNLSFNTPTFDWISLLNFPSIDYNSKNKILFNEKNFLKKLEKNCDISVFMNSFLICASKNDTNLLPKNILASNLQFLYHPKFQGIKNFILDNDNILIEDKKYNNNEFVSEEKLQYYTGYKNLLLLTIDTWQKKEFEDTAKYLNLWLKILKSKTISDTKSKDDFKFFCSSHITTELYHKNIEWLPGNFIDLILRNILIEKENNDIKIIDQEWKIKNNIPLKFVIDRGMYYLQLKMIQLTGCSLLTKEGHWNLPDEVIKLVPEIISKPDMKSLLLFDYWFHKGVIEGNFTHKLTKEDLKITCPSIFLRIKNKTFNYTKKIIKKILPFKFLKKISIILKR